MHGLVSVRTGDVYFSFVAVKMEGIGVEPRFQRLQMVTVERVAGVMDLVERYTKPAKK